MASDQTFVSFVVHQIENGEEIIAKKMFGEYGVYAGKKLFAQEAQVKNKVSI